MAAVSLLSPWRAALAGEFPIEPGQLPKWLPLTVSPAGTVQRLWELSLAIAICILARQAARTPGFGSRLAQFLGAAVLLLIASDIWYRLNGRRSILGVWEISWGTGAGTFANPNHFANWVCVAVLFLMGGVLRAVRPLQSARAQPLPAAQRDWAGGLVLLAIGVGGLVAAVASGSRGGFIALLAGTLAWLALLGRRTRSQRRWAMIAFGSLAVCVALIAVSDPLIRKLGKINAEFLSHYTKFQLWEQSLLLFLKFPLFGIGWGSFVTGLSHFKTGLGATTCWHAENEYLQLLVEAGVAGAVVYGTVLCRLLRPVLALAWRERLAEPEYTFGALAGLTAFCTGALYEFVFQIPANAALAAALFGCVLGSLDRAYGPAAPAPASNWRMGLNVALAAGLGGIAVLQGLAFLHWHKARRARSATEAVAQIQNSLRLWPWASNRQIGLTRQQVALIGGEPKSEQPSLSQACRRELQAALARDPYNWELRLERAWFDLAFSPNFSGAVAEAREAARLNPRQAQIPLRFARHLAERQPAVAREFLRLLDRSEPRLLRESLALSWRMDQDTSQLWALTPAGTNGWLTLGDFAVDQRLFPLAAQAYARLSGRVAPGELAGKFLAAQRPDLARAELAAAAPSLARDYLLCRAHFQAGDWPEVLRVVGGMLERSRWRIRLGSAEPATGDLAQLKAEWRTNANDEARAVRLADRLCLAPVGERELPLLRQLTGKFPRNLRLAWLVFTTERELGLGAAAETGVRLAGLLAAGE
jgi:hypothetical protein